MYRSFIRLSLRGLAFPTTLGGDVKKALVEFPHLKKKNVIGFHLGSKKKKAG